MILQSLVQYYEALEKKGEITKPGWSMANVSFALDISENGELLGVIPLKKEVERAKKKVLVPQSIKVPQLVSRCSDISPNFLCDNSKYMLGIDNKGKPERARECFESAKHRHMELLKGVNSKVSKAVVNYFERWEPDKALVNPILQECLDEIMAGANLIFNVDQMYAQEDMEVQSVWERSIESAGKGEEGICLVTGKKEEIARIHGTIKGVQGAQSSGAALVSFNAPAFESYGKEQSFNAPVGTYAAYAYTTALNHLLKDRGHTMNLGDITIVYWSEDAETEYQDVFAAVVDPVIDNQEIVHGVFQSLSVGKSIVVEDVEKSLNSNQKFYILGLSPNAARIAVRFFYQDSFGNILNNIKAHYDRMKVVRPAGDTIEYVGIWRLLQETVNKKSRDKKPLPTMAGSVYRAMVSGTPYPESLYQGVLARIRSEQDDKDNHTYKITRGRIGIIKAFLLRNRNRSKEEITMGLNEECEDVAYILGREFAVLEGIQEDANPGINATIKDRYFNGACATPAAVFPILFKLKNSHIRKINNRGYAIVQETLLGKLQSMITVQESQTAYPKQLSLEKQGMFILGYYHQTQKRYEKKIKEEV